MNVETTCKHANTCAWRLKRRARVDMFTSLRTVQTPTCKRSHALGDYAAFAPCDVHKSSRRKQKAIPPVCYNLIAVNQRTLPCGGAKSKQHNRRNHHGILYHNRSRRERPHVEGLRHDQTSGRSSRSHHRNDLSDDESRIHRVLHKLRPHLAGGV